MCVCVLGEGGDVALDFFSDSRCSQLNWIKEYWLCLFVF